MADDTTIDLASLRFEGQRFAGHALDVACTHELIAYRDLIVECAKELWRRKNPDRTRLPRGFDEDFRLQFNRLEDGSTVVPLQRIRVSNQSELDWGSLDEFDEAAELIDATIAAANADELLPEALPSNVIFLFKDFGKSLAEDEVLFTRSRHGLTEAAYTSKARKRLAEWVGPTYEDVVDVTGEVRMANLGPGTFSLQLEGTGVLVVGRFNPQQESDVLDALRNHQSRRLRVQGIAEFSTGDRQIKRFSRIDTVGPEAVQGQGFDEDAIPIWEQLAEIGESAPEGTWDSVPSDLSMRIDEVVYRRAPEIK
ncbi:MAG: hypothetical protein Q8L20_12050 [Gammaproteobacteria bacterium]|nr:hypothetical protein [Gammaproteobacteria bacterium]